MILNIIILKELRTKGLHNTELLWIRRVIDDQSIRVTARFQARCAAQVRASW